MSRFVAALFVAVAVAACADAANEAGHPLKKSLMPPIALNNSVANSAIVRRASAPVVNTSWKPASYNFWPKP